MNPWNSTTLEWGIPSPPPFDNFAGVHPVVNHGPYEYSCPRRCEGFRDADGSPGAVQKRNCSIIWVWLGL